MIRVEGLSKRYRSCQAVSDLSFEVSRGETFALVGPNGAGKTTTLKCLLGLTLPTTGSIGLGEAGLSPSDPLARRGIGYVPQRAEFTASMSVEQVLTYFARLKGLGDAPVGESLEATGLGPLRARRAGELSGGMTQRLALAQALLGNPDLLILDEPTASLDPEATHEFRALVQRIQAQGRTVLLCSHLLAEVERIADRVLVLVEGRAAATLSLKELRSPGAAPNLSFRADESGSPRPSLEDQFLDAIRKHRVGTPS